MGKRGTPRASCDPCRRKKVKCDKDQRNAEGMSLCSFCSARGFECIITEENGSAPTRPSKRMSPPTSTSAGVPTPSSTSSLSGGLAAPGSVSNAKPTSIEDASNGIDPYLFFPDQNLPEPDVMGVQGLTRTLLDEAVMQHFRRTHYCNPSIMPRHFFQRYRPYLQKLDGQGPSSPSDVAFPSPEILILSVACVGISQLRYLPQRFDLQKRIFMRLKHLVERADTADPSVALDIIEAILIASDTGPRDKNVQDFKRHSKNPLSLHPLGHEMMSRLVLHHGFNRSESDAMLKAQRAPFRTPENQAVWEMNAERIPLIVSIAATNDVLRSFGSFQRHVILDEDIDSDPMTCAPLGPIGSMWAQQLFMMASILRNHNIKICSAKSRRLGIPPTEIMALLDQLLNLERQLPDPVRWKIFNDSNTSTSTQLIEPEGVAEDFTSIIVRRASLHNFLWGQIVAFHGLVMAHGIRKPEGPQADYSLYLQARQKLDEAFLVAVDKIVESSSQLASLDLMDYSIIAFRNFPKATADYLLDMAKLAHKAGLTELTADLLSKAGRMLYAIGACSSHSETVRESAELRRTLGKLYDTFDMIPGLGAMDEAKLHEERCCFSMALESDAAVRPIFAHRASAILGDEVMSGLSSLGTATTWSTPSTAATSATAATIDPVGYATSLADLMAAYPLVSTGTGRPLPHVLQKSTPGSTSSQSSPFDLNAFLEAPIGPGS
ncbi:hypothetical protein BCV70DRAFT_193202 [Testicularia cyperi]|uniref:Zn(2)-C6 fungal-type domain-containing protein n=1 Tax=Testicularia cyperi TaxID=1882483 RepID=A0A317XJJ4_9BASI|nr:hypothetical protein BCV70DRAFT_193202 [Testicularia cyperi]